MNNKYNWNFIWKFTVRKNILILTDCNQVIIKRKNINAPKARENFYYYQNIAGFCENISMFKGKNQYIWFFLGPAQPGAGPTHH